jgi:deoxyribodipyrimidine photo-lyase
MKLPLVVYWVRRDLRLTDNPALTAALTASNERKVPFLPLFILEDYMVEALPQFQFGLPSRYFLAQALPAFAQQFPAFALVRSKAAEYLIQLANKYELSVYVNDDVYPDFYTQVQKLQAAGVSLMVSEDALSITKETRSQEGRLYSVFSPFKKSVWPQFINRKPLPLAQVAAVVPAHEVLASLPKQVVCTSEVLWSLFSKARTMLIGGAILDLSELVSPPELTSWYTSDAAAKASFMSYLQSGGLAAYDDNRNSLEDDVQGLGKTSKMSVALAWGLISPRTLMSLIQDHFAETFDNPLDTTASQGALTYISELIWREFYRYQLYHHPELMHTEFQERFRGTIAWESGEVAKDRFIAWIRGETGYAIVDAAMNQLARTGWMHNRARMVVASILTKNLGVDWRWGQEYFRAALIDLDEASNNGGWQWGASVGADPKPIRIFNPDLQAKNYDASGAYRAFWLTGEGLFGGVAAPLVPHTAARADALKRYGLRQ